MTKKHSFHIPVMGIGYTIDTPLKVSQYGMDSVIFISDDILLERLRKAFCKKFKIPYQEISDKIEDFRAKRITSYLNLINDKAREKFEELRTVTLDKAEEIKKYFNMLPDSSTIKQEFDRLTASYFNLQEIRTWIRENLSMGSIDVNIMTKLDRENYRNNQQLPVEYNNAHSALRGYANSNLESSIVFSAGMNPRLYSYLENFDDFYPDRHGYIKKKIILKVSDYRSALIQGKFLAKKGLWVSEYRIESGLNCGGHAFATDGYLMGPILAEFRDKRDELTKTIFDIFTQAISAKNRIIPDKELSIRVTAQGGVGTAEEHDFILDHYHVDSVGWGTPFLLVPEVTTVDDPTMDKLVKAKEEDLYLSNISPLGVPFNNLRGNTKDLEKLSFVAKGRPGSACPKKFLAINKEFTDTSICTASRQYQHLKLRELDDQKISAKEHKMKFEKIVDKSCLCVGLGAAALKVHEVDNKIEGEGVLICPGPNLAYFSKKMSLKEMTDHIYGRTNVISRKDRPNMFIKELNIYIEFLQNKISETSKSMKANQKKYLETFAENLKQGMSYYHQLFSDLKDKFEATRSGIQSDLESCGKKLEQLKSEIEKLYYDSSTQVK